MSFAEKIAARSKAEGISEGEAKGKAEGIAEGQTKIALNLLKEGAEPAFVVKVTGLSAEAVARLQESGKD